MGLEEPWDSALKRNLKKTLKNKPLTALRDVKPHFLVEKK